MPDLAKRHTSRTSTCSPWTPSAIRRPSTRAARAGARGVPPALRHLGHGPARARVRGRARLGDVLLHVAPVPRSQFDPARDPADRRPARAPAGARGHPARDLPRGHQADARGLRPRGRGARRSAAGRGAAPSSSSTGATTSPRRSSCGSSPTRSGCPRRAASTSCASATRRSTRSGRRTRSSRRACARARRPSSGSRSTASPRSCAPAGWARRSTRPPRAARSAGTRPSCSSRRSSRPGSDTTIFGIGNLLQAFARFPDQWDALRADPSRARAALRGDAALRLPRALRRPDHDARGGVRRRRVPGARGCCCSGSRPGATRGAGRTPTATTSGRKVTGHIGLGFGIHACVGQALARMEGETLFAALARRVERIELGRGAGGGGEHGGPRPRAPAPGAARRELMPTVVYVHPDGTESGSRPTSGRAS